MDTSMEYDKRKVYSGWMTGRNHEVSIIVAHLWHQCLYNFKIKLQSKEDNWK